MRVWNTETLDGNADPYCARSRLERPCKLSDTPPQRLIHPLLQFKYVVDRLLRDQEDMASVNRPDVKNCQELIILPHTMRR